MVGKYFLLFSFVLSVHFACVAQVTGKLIIGLHGSQIDGDGLSGYNKPGLIAGAGMELFLKKNKKIALQPEITYSQKGSRSTDKSPFYLVVRLQYIDFSIPINLYIKEGLALQPGISVAYLLKGTADGSLGTGFFDQTSIYKPFDTNTFLGVDYHVTPKTAVNIRFAYSVVSFIQSKARWHNNSIAFTVRFSLN